ncbi:DUF3810 domain-containing protein [Salegentibacter maritimus]|uniref:DUF3810 domain-containing protein n=1 Tax=Salegentibacter maritimus TaxID=2794347 RepID=UPI0018E49240|nr:DUF3810 domain-containing protein [Salegentibacter maritimus]MBI6116508.1 DUF3810 domain-containing protein [Salegentibacter maritimus]
MKKKGLYILAFLLPLQVIFIFFLGGYPELVENWYSNLIYPKISKLMRYGHGFLPFSLGDLLYTFFGILIIRWLTRRFQQKFRNPRFWVIDTMAVLSLVYACFHIFWGFNYYRLPLHKTLKIENNYTTEELYSLSEILITESNKLHQQLADNDSVSVVIPYSKDEIFAKTITGFTNISKTYPELTYKGESLKRSLYSIPLSYMGFNGYLNPLTGEAQVNTQIVPYKIPTTASHEIGHQLGFAKENEANFIACLSTMNHPDAYFRYSGYTFALRYCLSELYRRDPDKFEILKAKMNVGILKNYREVEDFWLAHQNPFEPLFQAFYNRFLIVNNQADGMKSYSYVVALLVNYFSEEKNSL